MKDFILTKLPQISMAAIIVFAFIINLVKYILDAKDENEKNVFGFIKIAMNAFYDFPKALNIIFVIITSIIMLPGSIVSWVVIALIEVIQSLINLFKTSKKGTRKT